MTRVDFCLVDSGLAAHSLLSTQYTKTGFDQQPRTYTEHSGIYLRLHGRPNDGRSVVVESELREGLWTSFLDERDQQNDQAFAAKILDEVL